MSAHPAAALPAQWREIALRQVEHALHGLKEWRATYPHILATSVIAATADLRDAADLLRNAARQAQGETTCPTCTDQETPKRGSFLYSNCYGHANGPHPKDCYSCFHESKRQAANAEEEPPAPTSPRLTVVGNGAIAQSIAAAIGEPAPAPTGDRALRDRLIAALTDEVLDSATVSVAWESETDYDKLRENIADAVLKALPALPVVAETPTDEVKP